MSLTERRILLDRVAGLLPSLLARGPVYLLALFLRQEAALGQWSVMLSAAWADGPGNAEGVRAIIEPLKVALTLQEFFRISHVAVIDSGDPELMELAGAFQLENGRVEERDFTFRHEGIEHAYFFRLQRPPVRAEAELAAV